MENFKNIERGDIIKHISESKTYVVIANYGNRVTAVAVVDMTNPSEWEKVTPIAQQSLSGSDKSSPKCHGKVDCPDDCYGRVDGEFVIPVTLQINSNVERNIQIPKSDIETSDVR